jgi:hypothetical protein
MIQTAAGVCSCHVSRLTVAATHAQQQKQHALLAHALRCRHAWPLAAVCVQLEGSVKSAQTLFARYDMDLDMRLKQQDFYDLMLELGLALPYQEYQRFVDASFACTGKCAGAIVVLVVA